MHRHGLSTEALLRLIKPNVICSKLEPKKLTQTQPNKLTQTNKLVQIKPTEKSLTIIKSIVLTKVEPPYIFFP